ncbi:MAG: hydroxyphenylacetyl-CoA thioesterase PaaI [Actinomycetota bacterium]
MSSDGQQPQPPTGAEVVDTMFGRDRASQGLGMQVVESGLGRAVVTMIVRPDMVNGLDVCHGGLIFSLADSAMAFSTNDEDRAAVATNASIDWISPGRLGSTLTATAVEKHRYGRNAVTDVTVVDETGQLIALFRGKTRQVDGRPLG